MHRQSSSSRRPKAGFTLLELLVSTSVVLLLASLLLPAVNSVKAKTQRVQCQQNQRQVLLGWTLFANDHSGSFPSNGYTPGGGDSRQPRWVQGYLNQKAAPRDAVNDRLLVGREYAQLAPYVTSPSLYDCPADRSSVEIDGRLEQRLRSYSMNAYVGWDGPVQRPLLQGYRVFRSNSDLEKFGASRMMVLLDVNPESICWPFFGVHMEGGDRSQFFAFPGGHHSRGAVVGFADGHVEHHRWQDERTVNPGNVLYHAHDTPSQQNPDLDWLRFRASSR